MANPVSANAAALYVSGTSTVDASEACSQIGGSGASQVYQATNTAKRTWDPTVPIVVKDGGTAVSAADYTFDYLSSVVSFSGYTPGGAITLDGNYLPIWQLAQPTKWSIGIKRALIDSTTMDGAGAVERFATIADAEGSFNVNEPGNTVLDGTSMTLESILAGGAMIVLVCQLGPSSNNRFRAFVQLESEKTDGDVKDIFKGTINWKLSNQVQTAIAWSINP